MVLFNEYLEEIMCVHTFLKGISQKVNAIVGVEKIVLHQIIVAPVIF